MARSTVPRSLSACPPVDPLRYKLLDLVRYDELPPDECRSGLAILTGDPSRGPVTAPFRIDGVKPRLAMCRRPPV